MCPKPLLHFCRVLIGSEMSLPKVDPNLPPAAMWPLSWPRFSANLAISHLEPWWSHFWVMSQISLSMTLVSQLHVWSAHLEGILWPKKDSEPDYRTFSVDWLIRSIFGLTILGPPLLSLTTKQLHSGTFVLNSPVNVPEWRPQQQCFSVVTQSWSIFDLLGMGCFCVI